MRYCLLASGSNGNCCFVEAGGLRLLIDIGLGPRILRRRLEPLGVAPPSLTHLLLTHEHHDHVCGLRPLLRAQPQLQILTSAATAAALPPEARKRTTILGRGSTVQLERAVSLAAVAVPHDAAGALAFRLEAGTGTLGYATDLGSATEEIVAALSGCHALVVEANHCLRLLRSGPYPLLLKRRVAGPRGHLSNEQCAKLLERLLCSRARQVTFAHLSAVNNSLAALRRATSSLVQSYPSVSWEVGSRHGALAPRKLPHPSGGSSGSLAHARQLELRGLIDRNVTRQPG